MKRHDRLWVAGSVILVLVGGVLAALALLSGVDRSIVRTAWGLLAVAGILLFAWLSHREVQAKRGGLDSGQEKLLGAIGTVTEDCKPSGRIRVGMEIWDAVASPGAGFRKGERVRIASVKDGFQVVERARAGMGSENDETA